MQGELLAGCYPGDEDADSADKKLAGLVNASIGTVVNLMEPDESNWAGAPFRPYQDCVLAIGKMIGFDVDCLRFPIRDTHIPTHEQMQEILDAIDASLAKGSGVYVHCWGGKGRTGTVVGCYLIRHGLATPDNFVEAIEKLRGSDAKTGPSPENDKQVQFVRDFCDV